MDRKAFIVVSNMRVEEVDVIRNERDFCIVGNSFRQTGIRVRRSRVYATRQEAEKHLATKGRRLIGWDEILEGGLSPDATVMSWRGNAGGIEAAHQHHNVIMSPTSHCYIDYYQLADRSKQPACEGGFVSVSKMYSFDPIPQEIPEDEKKYIMGAQCNLWTHYADSPARAMYQILPRLAAMSEVQWLMPQQKDFEAFKQRLSGIEKMYDKLGYNYCPTYE